MTHLRAADWEVRSIPFHAEVRELCQRWHYAGSVPNTSTYRHGLYPAEEMLSYAYGAALWIPPTRTAAESVAQEDWGGCCP